ncbi:peptidase [Xylaria longipes]|nr:peptidase [Xylaria longipes]
MCHSEYADHVVYHKDQIAVGRNTLGFCIVIIAVAPSIGAMYKVQRGTISILGYGGSYYRSKGFKAQLGFLILAAVADAVPFEHTQLSSTQIQAANAGLVLTDNYHALSRIWQQPGVSRTLDILKKTRRNNVFKDNASPSPDDDLIVVDHIRAELNQVEYIMKVGIGPYYMIPDTGSSDTWTAQEEKSSRVQFTLVNVAAFGGDGISSGILGLGLWGLTTAFTVNDPSLDGLDNLVNYVPLMETIGTSETASPMLSFAMSRQENRSYIAFRQSLRANMPHPYPKRRTTLNLLHLAW